MTPATLRSLNARPPACRSAAVPVTAAVRWGTSQSVHPNAVIRTWRRPDLRPALMVRIPPRARRRDDGQRGQAERDAHPVPSSAAVPGMFGVEDKRSAFASGRRHDAG